MRSFSYQRAENPAAAMQALSAAASSDRPFTEAESLPLAGGTTLIDLMKLDVMRPRMLVDINPLASRWSAMEMSTDHLRLGALARMSDVADNADVQRHYPVIAEALKLAASQQIRNMATLGGNVLQRTRCSYFRDVSYDSCNKRNPGSGCAAMEGFNRAHAVLGTSDQCIATYPGDFAQALIALNASVEITGKSGTRSLPFEQLHKQPGRSPQVETTLEPGELISAFLIQGRWPRSLYLKVRDRQSYEFALASAAVALDVQDGFVRDARLALGGVATVPWRAREVEILLKDQKLDDTLARRVAEAAFATAMPRKHNAFKIELGQRLVARALHQAATMEI
jgi:xanthine dehydrogenase YagS FAD-binding subunit